MDPFASFVRRFKSVRTWSVLSVFAPVGMLVISGLMLLDLRQDAYDKTEHTSRNLLQVIERDIARNFEIFDLSLQGAIDNLASLGIEAIRPELRQLVLFDRATTAQDMGAMLILDARGDVIQDASALPPRQGNYADREYFRVHRQRADLGLYIGAPIVSRLTGERMLPFSRRINKPDGSFGGVAFGSLKLSYFSRLFDSIVMDGNGAINLYFRDGTRIMRHPYQEADLGANIANAPTFRRFVSAPSGSFIGTSVRDGIERQYAFTQIGTLPLILNVALSTRDIEAEWRTKALVIGVTVLVLCGLTIALSLLFDRELRRRAAVEAELSRLSRTDTLTGLANRRYFEEAIARVWDDDRRAGRSTSLLIIDADHFKRYNDRYGHAVGDAVLKRLASRLAASVERPGDFVARIGGEEFAIVLPGTPQQGAERVAAAVHAAIRSVDVTAAGIEAGSVTVSIGVATHAPGVTAYVEDLYRGADAALYEAKANGRNQTRHAAFPRDRPGERQLRLVGR